MRRSGAYSFSMLLFQDLAVAPLLFLVAMLTGGEAGRRIVLNWR